MKSRNFILCIMIGIIYLIPGFDLLAQEDTDEHKYFRISVSSFESYSDMIRRLITGQLDIGPKEVGETLPALDLSDLSEEEIKLIEQLLEEHLLPSDTFAVAGQLERFSNIDERVKYMDSTTNYAYYALPPLKDKKVEFRSELDVDKLKIQPPLPHKPIYRISVNGDFEYYDGNPISGAKSIKKKYNEGYKPVSEVTFFYQAKKNGIIVEGLTAKEFLALSREEQKLILHNAIMMINEEKEKANPNPADK